ncbi:MAG: hypothetical protein KIS66_17740 [Fimbriimonadaceae bacterium]|nr:hypothetical protein [Fimbriimonadaceae bacterium]
MLTIAASFVSIDRTIPLAPVPKALTVPCALETSPSTFEAIPSTRLVIDSTFSPIVSTRAIRG